MARQQQGFVLVCVMWILALLTVMALSFSHRAMMEHRASAYSVDRTQALYMARGAVTRGIVEVRNKAIVDRMQGLGGRTSFDQRWASPPDMFRDESYYELGGEEETTDEVCVYIIEDAERYLSINAAPSELLEEIPTLSLRIVNQIARQRDVSAEDERSRAFLTVEELRSLDGMTDDAWFGDDETPPLPDILTVYGDGRINLNTCSFAVFNTVPNLDDDVKQRIAAHLKMPPVPVKHELKPPSTEEEGEGGEAGAAAAEGGEGLPGTSASAEAAADAPSAPDGGASGRSTLVSFEELIQLGIVEREDLGVLQEYCKLDSSFFTITGFATQRQGKVTAKVTATVQALEDRSEILSWREETVGY